MKVRKRTTKNKNKKNPTTLHSLPYRQLQSKLYYTASFGQYAFQDVPWSLAHILK